MHRNLWLHTLPDCTTFDDAVAMLKKWDAWDAVPASVRDHLLRADPRQETVKADEFQQMTFRIFGVMPDHLGVLPTAQQKAAELGFTPHADVALYAGRGQPGRAASWPTSPGPSSSDGQPFEPPCALLSARRVAGDGGRGERHRRAQPGVCPGGGAAASRAARTSSSAAWTPTAPTARAGTLPTMHGGHPLPGRRHRGWRDRCRSAGRRAWISTRNCKRHNTSPALWKLESGIVAAQNISVATWT